MEETKGKYGAVVEWRSIYRIKASAIEALDRSVTGMGQTSVRVALFFFLSFAGGLESSLPSPLFFSASSFSSALEEDDFIVRFFFAATRTSMSTAGVEEDAPVGSSR